MKNNRINRLIFIIICFFVMSGFSLLGSQVWKISTTDRTIWVKGCSTFLAKTFSNNLGNASDIIGSATSYTGTDIINSIVTDYNSINGSFLRLAIYPADPNSPGAPQTGDTTFTTALASERTITLCFDNSLSGSRSGEAAQTASSSKITGCNIKLKETTDMKSLIATLTHELGHCVGLDHPMETTNAIMSYFKRSGSYRLMSDDKMGIVFQYPKSSVDAKEANTFGLSCAKK